jgi:hypothetical protein
MTEAGLAVFGVLGFLLPVPVLAWLDRPAGTRQHESVRGPSREV